MHNKVLALLMAAIVAVMSTVTAFATDSSELPAWLGGPVTGSEGIEDEIFIPSTPLELPNGSHSTAQVGDTVGVEEASTDRTSTYSMLTSGETGSNPVVDVSDESIAAIADAIVVGQYYYGTVLVTSDFENFYVPQEAYAYPYLCLVDLDFTAYLFCFASVPSGTTETVGTPSATFTCNMFEATMEGGVWKSVENVERPLGYYARQHNDVYSEFEVYYNGEKQDYFPLDSRAVTVTFETGFEDIVVPPMSATNFYLPGLHKDGMVFKGWSMDPIAFEPVPSGWIPTANTTLYATWSSATSIIYFWQMVYGSMVELFNTEPFSQIFGLIAFCMILAVIRLFINTR